MFVRTVSGSCRHPRSQCGKSGVFHIGIRGAVSPSNALDEGEQLLPIQNLSKQTLCSSEPPLLPLPPLPPLPSLPVSEPAAFALVDPGSPQAKAQLSKDMPKLQSGCSQATNAKGPSWVLLSGRLNCLRVVLYLLTRILYPICGWGGGAVDAGCVEVIPMFLVTVVRTSETENQM